MAEGRKLHSWIHLPADLPTAKQRRHSLTQSWRGLCVRGGFRGTMYEDFVQIPLQISQTFIRSEEWISPGRHQSHCRWVGQGKVGLGWVGWGGVGGVCPFPIVFLDQAPQIVDAVGGRCIAFGPF
jgi:hypothetical protein